MKTASLSTVSLASLLLAASGCGKPAVEHNLTPPPSPTAYRAPTTKEEKIAAIKKSFMPKEQQQAAIDKVNSGQ